MAQSHHLPLVCKAHVTMEEEENRGLLPLLALVPRSPEGKRSRYVEDDLVAFSPEIKRSRRGHAYHICPTRQDLPYRDHTNAQTGIFDEWLPRGCHIFALSCAYPSLSYCTHPMLF